MPLEVSFRTKELRRLCENRSAAIDAFGVDDAVRLQNRLADLCAANSINDIIVGNAQMIEADQNSLYQISIGNEKEILLKPNHLKIPSDSDGSVDWNLVTRVQIISLGGCEYDD